jgi:hypothetical protein
MAPRAPSVAHEPPATYEPSVARAPALPCVPAASIATADLRAELNRRRDGEDSRITIKCQHERHRNIEGRNLERELTLLHRREKRPLHALHCTPS